MSRPSFVAHRVQFYDLEPIAINCMAYESNTRKLALSRADSSIETWDLSFTPHMERKISSDSHGSVEALAWYKDRLFSTGLQGFVIEHDFLKLAPKSEVPLTGGAAWSMEVYPPKSYLIVGTEGGFLNLLKITSTELTLLRILGRQEGRIMCLAWDLSGEYIATGSPNTLRIWETNSNQAIQRMTIAKEKQKDTIVWCLAFAENFAVFSGDSRGRLSIWDGRTGTLLESFHSHQADILTLCMSQDLKHIYCSGIDPIIVHWSYIELKQSKNDAPEKPCSRKWIRRARRNIHEHDVHSLILVGNQLFSGGVDGCLTVSNASKVVHKYSPGLQPPFVHICPESRCLMLRYPKHLDLWRLSEPSRDASGGFAFQVPAHQLEFRSRNNEAIVCAAISPSAEWLAYSTMSNMFFYSVSIDGYPVSVRKLTSLDRRHDASYHLLFMPDSSAMVAVTSSAISIWSMHQDGPTLVHTIHLHTDKLLTDSVKLLTTSPDGKYLIAADHQSNIAVWTTSDWKHYYTLPKYRFAPTAMSVEPQTNNMMLVYADHKILELNLEACTFTEFSRLLGTKCPPFWHTRSHVIHNITFSPQEVILQGNNSLFCISKSKGLKEEGINKKKKKTDTANEPVFSTVQTLKDIVFVGHLQDELLVVQLNPVALANLPPVLRKKKFGQ